MAENQSALLETIKLQQQASDPSNSVWVFASAGSGKTKVLTDRVLRLLLSGVPANKILCLTYTNAAANEMQNRIYKNLSEWILLQRDELENLLFEISGKKPSNDEIKTAQSLFIKVLDDESPLKIQTIHSFCQNLIKIFPFEVGIQPNFEIIDEKKEKILLLKARKHILQKAVLNDNLRNVITSITSRLGEENLFDLINEFLKQKEKITLLKEEFFNIENITNEISKTLGIKLDENKENLFLWLKNEIEKDCADLKNLAQELEDSKAKSDINTKLAIQNAINLQSDDKKLFFDSYKDAFLTKENEPRKIVITKAYQNDKNDNLIKEQQKLLTTFLEKEIALQIAKSSADILRLVDEILQEYFLLKRKNSYLDYNDLIIKTNQLLQNPQYCQWVKYKTDGFFDHILIDESQDTNEFQWNIIKAITEDFFSGSSSSTKNRSIFIVGDEKQSIFSFQGANPHLAKEIHDYFANRLQDYQSKLHKINLNSSFRSLQTILKTTDQVFLKTENRAAITFIDKFSGHTQIKEGIGRVEILPIINKKESDKPKQTNEGWEIDFTPKEDYDEQEFLAEILALKIKNWIEKGKIIESENRVIKYGDIMVLLRKRSGFDKTLSKSLQKYQIPNSLNSKITLTNHIIIQDFISLAKFCLSQNDNLSLAESLKSPIFNLSEEDLLEICLLKNQKNISLFHAISQIPKFKLVKVKLKEFISKSKKLNAFDFFNFVLNNDQNREKIISRIAKNNENEIESIINQFLNLTYEFSKNSSSNLQEFIGYLTKLEPQINTNSNDNSQDKVKITTIHSAKGLQSPIIIMPDCTFSKLKSDRILWINNLPFWLTSKSTQNSFIKIHKDFKDSKNKNEDLRLLYVAMTRAKDELYIAGFGKALQDSWYARISNSLDEINCSNQEFLEDEIKENLASKLDLFEFEHFTKVVGKDHIFSKNLSKEEENSNQNLPDFIKKFSSPTKQISKKSKTTNSKARQGILIHKILEIIGKFSKNFDNIDKIYLNDLVKKIIQNDQNLVQDQKNQVLEQIAQFINSETFDELFSKNNRFELPISGFINDKFVNQRIDLLVIKNNEILIIDYKSDENPDDKIPQEYQEQLNSYKKLISDLYPNHKIQTAILWTKSLQINYTK